MKEPYVLIRPKHCCGMTRKNRFYRALCNGFLPPRHRTRPYLKVSLTYLPKAMDKAITAMRSKS